MTCPIPRYLLIHSCTLKKPTETTVWGNKSSSETELSFVRIEPVRQRAYSLSADMPMLKATLFYDCVTSMPQNVEFATGDTVVFVNDEYIVESVKTFYADGALPHHLEVMLK